MNATQFRPVRCKGDQSSFIGADADTSCSRHMFAGAAGKSGGWVSAKARQSRQSPNRVQYPDIIQTEEPITTRQSTWKPFPVQPVRSVVNWGHSHSLKILTILTAMFFFPWCSGVWKHLVCVYVKHLGPCLYGMVIELTSLCYEITAPLFLQCNIS